MTPVSLARNGQQCPPILVNKISGGSFISTGVDRLLQNHLK
jgi:hypothetical protein